MHQRGRVSLDYPLSSAQFFGIAKAVLQGIICVYDGFEWTGLHPLNEAAAQAYLHKKLRYVSIHSLVKLTYLESDSRSTRFDFEVNVNIILTDDTFAIEPAIQIACGKMLTDCRSKLSDGSGWGQLVGAFAALGSVDVYTLIELGSCEESWAFSKWVSPGTKQVTGEYLFKLVLPAAQALDEEMPTLHRSGRIWETRNKGGSSCAQGETTFVVMPDGTIRAGGTKYGHSTLSRGCEVLYAGIAHFKDGELTCWDNGSGHYKPSPDRAYQAPFPFLKFCPTGASFDSEVIEKMRREILSVVLKDSEIQNLIIDFMFFNQRRDLVALTKGKTG